MKVSLAVISFATRKARVAFLVSMTALLAATSILLVTVNTTGRSSSGGAHLGVAKVTPQSHLHVPREEHPRRSFVLAVRQAEQIISGIRNSLQLGHLFGDVGAVLVEPYVVGTRLFGLPNFAAPRDSGRAYPLAKVLDFSRISRECSGIQEPVSLETFLHTSSRNIVLLHPVRGEDRDRGSQLWQSLYANRSTVEGVFRCIDTASRVCDCGHILGPFATRIEKMLDPGSGSGDRFSVVKIVCFDADKPMTVQTLLQQSGVLHRSDSPQLLSYIFTFWFGSSCVKRSSFPHSDAAGKVADSFEPFDSFDLETGPPEGTSMESMRDGAKDTNLKCSNSNRVHLVPMAKFPRNCWTTRKTFTSAQFISLHLKEIASAFVDSQGLDNASRFISIHFRTEWLHVLSTKRGSSKKQRQSCCMNELNKLLSSFSEELPNSIQKNTMFITDMGPYGSYSCNEGCRKFTSSLINQVRREHHLEPVYFEPKRYGFGSNAIVASLVEHLALAQGRYLVLVGGGKFQMGIAASALQNGRVERIYSVCSDTTESSRDYPLGVRHYLLNSCLYA